jgi:3-oxoacyl-[acyl-carrier protein] reductase
MLAEQAQTQRLDPEDMTGRVAVVTGGATGVGRAVALEFARRGVSVAFNWLNLRGRDIAGQALLTEAEIRSRGVGVYSSDVDIRDSKSVREFIATAASELGGIHYLVNNAGISRDGAIWSMSDEAWQDVLQTNATGAFNGIQAVAPYFKDQRYGKIVNVSSHQSFNPGFGVANFAASKAAVIGLTKAAAVELGPSNVNVNAVAPGYVKTEALKDLPADVLAKAEKTSVLGRIAEPEEVARVMVFLCSEQARHITGQVIFIDGGMTLT